MRATQSTRPTRKASRHFGAQRIYRRAAGFFGVAFVASLLFLASITHAQDDASVSYKRKTVINFEDDTIEGDLKTPDGQYLEARKKLRHRSLIRIRTEWRREVLGSIADL